nr:dipeptide epimerase [Coralloluteibacterium stylophorae]
MGLLRVPLRVPFRTALRCVDEVVEVVVELHTDSGHVGRGAAPPTPPITGETVESIVGAIRHAIRPRLLGAAVADLDRNARLVAAALDGNSSAKAAVDIALHDLFGQLHGAPLYRLLGGGPALFSTDITISAGDTGAMVADALAALDRGFEVLKVKLGREPAADLARIRAVHAAVGGRARLRLDANQGWSAAQAVRTLRELEDEGLAFDLLEQPVPADDLDSLEHVTRRIATPVLADESVFGPREALEVIRRGAADLINIKLMKTGGIGDALRVADIAAMHGVGCMIGCMLESGIGVTAAAHVAAARASVIGRVDLDGPSLCARDPLDGGAIFDGPDIRLADAPGLGIRAVHGLAPLPD